MATNKHSGGPGTNQRGGVISTIENANNVAVAQPSNGMKAPFDKPHAMGNGGIPVTMYDTRIKTPKMPTPTQPAPSVQGQKRPGTK